MKFTSLTTMIISATAMAGVVIASSLDNPIGRLCRGTGGCETQADFNDGKSFIFTCQNKMIVAFEACEGNTKCQLIGGTLVCR
ncbi:hypothetical protein EDB19DRAFT_1775216 [Suillus lakei]|nr:hypothetical protein EDB19DRAFT_1775216 [Suillus lakei]